jgi:hypothetical protein
MMADKANEGKTKSTEKPGVKNQTARFTSSAVKDMTLSVFLRRGKKGINVAVRHKAPGAKTKTGQRATFESTQIAEAQAAFDERVKTATEKGWVAQAKTARARGGFTEMPDPNVAPTPAAPAGGGKADGAKAGSGSQGSAGKKR